MKKTSKATLFVALIILPLLFLAACGKSDGKTLLWENATYLADTTLGEGEKTVVAEVKAEERTITFTIQTDEDTVGAALLEHGLIAGDESEYGLYIKAVNGMTADYDADKSYWAFYVDGEYATSGVDAAEIKEGVKYQFVHTK